LKLTQSTLRIERQLQDGAHTFHLRTPIQVDVAEENGLWHCESKLLGIFAGGLSQEVALGSFAERGRVKSSLVLKAAGESLDGQTQACPTLNPAVVLIVTADPKPHNPVGLHRAEGTIVGADAHRIDPVLASRFTRSGNSAKASQNRRVVDSIKTDPSREAPSYPTD
jgi:hypothetical protein